MELKEAFEALRPTLIALNAVALKLDEIDKIDAQIKDGQKVIAAAEAARAEVIASRQAAQQAEAQRVGAQKEGEKLLREAKSQAIEIVGEANAEADKIINRQIAEAKEKVTQVEVELAHAETKLAKVQRDTKEALQKHDEVMASVAALKAKL